MASKSSPIFFSGEAAGPPDPVVSRRQRLYRLSYDSLILHCPGPQRATTNPFHEQWISACDTFFADAETRDGMKDLSFLTIITYNNNANRCLLERCADHLGLKNVVVLGRSVAQWQWIHKIAVVLEYLESGARETRYILCLDGDDVLIVGQPSEMFDRFQEMNCGIAFCNTRGNQPADEACWRFENSIAEYRDPLHRHLNAGGYIGDAAYIKQCLGEIMNAYRNEEPWAFSCTGFDDQLCWRHLHRRYYPNIKVDAACRIFLRFDEDR